MLVRQQERCHNALAICPACIGNVSVSDSSVFDGMGEPILGENHTGTALVIQIVGMCMIVLSAISIGLAKPKKS